MNKERLAMIQAYYAKQETVICEIPAIVSKNGNQTIISRFTGRRAGYDFREGKATVKRCDVWKLQEIHPNLIIHEETKGDMK